MELVHTYICDLSDIRSLRHNKYIQTFIDGFTRKTWIYLLKEKSKAFNKFKEFKVPIERQSGCNIKILRYDIRGEYWDEPLKARHDVTKLDLIVPLLSFWCINIDLSI